jgi:hypothetical protein
MIHNLSQLTYQQEKKYNKKLLLVYTLQLSPRNYIVSFPMMKLTA